MIEKFGEDPGEGRAVKESRDVYFSDRRHREWGGAHYFDSYKAGERDAAVLLFAREWAEAHLPPQGEEGLLRVVLLDTQDGRRYETSMPAYYEDDEHWLPPRWDGTPTRELQVHFYARHRCACHRKAAAEHHGAETDGECEGGRFVIDEITAPGLPGLVLYSETRSEGELEKLLCGEGVPCPN